MNLRVSKKLTELFVVLLLLTSCSSKEKKIELQPFNSISIQCDSKIILEPAKKTSLCLYGSAQSLKNTDVQVNDRTLNITNKSGAVDSIIIYYTDLQDITACKKAQLYSYKPITTDFLVLDLSDHCSALLSVQTEYLISQLKDFATLNFSSGQTHRHEIEMEDSSNLIAYPLNTNITQIVHNGYGKAEISSQSLMDIKMNQKGQVSYKGYGKVRRTSKGSGIIFDANIYTE